jgi:hypothetical protein
MDNNEIKYLGDLVRLDLKPSDILVLQTDEKLNIEQRIQIMQMFRDIENELLILDGGMKLGVLSEKPNES